MEYTEMTITNGRFVQLVDGHLKGVSLGIVTILKTNNYGAELQAYALCRKLNDLGFDAEIVDFLFYKNKGFKRTRRAKPFVHLGIKRKIKEYINPIFENLRSFFNRNDLLVRNDKFKAFHEKNTRLSNQSFSSIEKLYGFEHNYDVFVVGSDQVWNPYSNVNLEPYFLSFAPKGKKKISDASSFGVSKIPVDAQPFYSELLNNLDHISVREDQGVKLVHELTGRIACHVLDPTLLLDRQDWQKVACVPKVMKSYLLLYVLTDSDYTTQLARKIAEELSLIIVRICKNAVRQDADNNITNIIDAGPAEFVGLFMNASFVITNSFHGTTFSVNFEKSFYTVLPKSKPNNSRQEGFLGLLGLGHRLISEGSPYPKKEKYTTDFSEASALLVAEKEKSINYLISCVTAP